MLFSRVDINFKGRCTAVLPIRAMQKTAWRETAMIESALKGIAFVALASIAINTVKWLLRHPAALLLTTAILAVTAWLMP
jgi:hypothetical protein